MSYLVDTNVVSEWTKPRPDPAVVAFLASTDEDLLFLSVITLAELRRGVDRLPAGRRRAALNEWLAKDLLHRFGGRILGIDRDVASAWGRITAQAERRGRTPGVMDVWIAAVAEVHGLTLATRNVAGFALLLEHASSTPGMGLKGDVPAGVVRSLAHSQRPRHVPHVNRPGASR